MELQWRPCSPHSYHLPPLTRAFFRGLMEVNDNASHSYGPPFLSPTPPVSVQAIPEHGMIGTQAGSLPAATNH